MGNFSVAQKTRFLSKPTRRTLILLSCLLPAGFSHAQQASDTVEPETGTVVQSNTQSASYSQQMVVTAHPLATQAGAEILSAGGNAIDAMVTVQTVLGLVEPQSSGLGGGAFLLYYDAEKQALTTYDGRETAPSAATAELFMDDDGKPLKFFDAVVGGRSVGVPGTVKLLFDTHVKYGELNWNSLLSPATKLAHSGFSVSKRLSDSIQRDSKRLATYPDTKAYFFPNGSALQEGDLLVNESYAKTLTQLAVQGADYFYKGEAAERIAEKVTNAMDNPGVLSKQDLTQYQIKERAPICSTFRQFKVCGMGPPSSGQLTLAQVLGMIEPFNLEQYDPDSPIAWQIIADATRLAFADRGRYIADTDFVSVPQNLISPEYLTNRSQLIKPGKALSKTEVKPGRPDPGLSHLSDDQSIELPSTSHFVIRDKWGNLVSMTTTIENGFGSRLMVDGFLLNNELTDFSFVSHKDGKPVANRVEPGKRPRSSMAPTIVFKDNKPYMAIGSPGGSRIISYVTNTLIRHFVWGQDIHTAINEPHLINRFGTYDVEPDTPVSLITGLEALGYEVKKRTLNSGIHAITLHEDKLIPGIDKRREGQAAGL